MSINRANISGNLTRDAELRETQGGSSVLNFSVAVNDRRRNPQTGEWEDYPNFIDCVVFGARAEALANILRKGMKVAVEGKLRWSQWEREGQKRSKVEVVVDEVEFLSRRDSDGEGGRRRQTNAGGYPTRAMSPDEIPAPQGQVVAPGVYQPALQPQQPAQGDLYDQEIPF